MLIIAQDKQGSICTVAVRAGWRMAVSFHLSFFRFLMENSLFRIHGEHLAFNGTGFITELEDQRILASISTIPIGGSDQGVRLALTGPVLRRIPHLQPLAF
jgi:hypothetical protein